MSAEPEPRFAHRVLKYPITIAGTFTVRMVPGARVVHVAAQGGEPFMWAIVPTGDGSQELRTFHLRGTGHGVEPGLRYLGSFMLHDGEFVGHLFEHTERGLADFGTSERVAALEVLRALIERAERDALPDRSDSPGTRSPIPWRPPAPSTAS